MDDLRIYNIPAKLADALADVRVDEETGEIVGAMALERLQMDASQKVAYTARYLKNRKALLGQMEDHCKAMQMRIKAEKKRQEWLKNRTLEALQALGVKSIETPDILVKTSKKPPVLIVDDEGQIPASFFKEKTETVLVKTAVIDALKAGTEVPGAHLDTAAVRLVIR